MERSLSKQAAQARYDSMMAAQLNAMLAQTLGANKAYVQVNADVNANQVNSDALTYKGKPIPLTQTVNTESLTGGGATAGGAAGTAANIPGVAAAGTGSTSKYNHKQTATTFGVNKDVTHSIIAPGAINRQSVSVLVDSSVPKSAIPALQAAVTNAAGICRTSAVTRSPSDRSRSRRSRRRLRRKPSPMMSYVKYGVVGVRRDSVPVLRRPAAPAPGERAVRRQPDLGSRARVAAAARGARGRREPPDKGRSAEQPRQRR